MLQVSIDFFTIFQVMDKPERAVFKKFISYRCTEKKAEPLLKLITYLSSQNGEFRIEKEMLIKLQRATACGTEAQFHGVIKDSKALLDDFLIHQQLDKQKTEKDKLLAFALEERNLYDAFVEQVNKVTLDLEKKITEGKNLEPTDFLVISKLNEKLFFHPVTNKYKPEVNEWDKTFINLDKSYVLKKMRLLSDLSIRQNFLSNQASIESGYLLSLAKSFPEPIFQLYAQLLSLLDNHDDSLFKQLLLDIKAQANSLNVVDIAIFFEKLTNHANKIYETGNIDYLYHLWELMQMSDQNDMIAQNNNIDALVFINAVAVGSSVGALEWVQQFIEKYSALLSGSRGKKDETLKIANAYIYFFDGKYDEALKNIKKVKNLGILLSSRTLALRIHYEQFFTYRIETHYSSFTKEIEAFTRFLQKDREKKLTDSKRQAIKNFIKVLEYFVHFLNLENASERPERLVQIEAHLSSLSPIIAKGWLYTKFNDLKNIKKLNQLP